MIRQFEICKAQDKFTSLMAKIVQRSGYFCKQHSRLLKRFLSDSSYPFASITALLSEGPPPSEQPPSLSLFHKCLQRASRCCPFEKIQQADDRIRQVLKSDSTPFFPPKRPLSPINFSPVS